MAVLIRVILLLLLLATCGLESLSLRAQQPTTTTLSYASGNNLGDPTVFTASVSSGGTPITRGEVVFYIDQKEVRSVQIVGSNAGEARRLGTATLFLPLLSGAYEAKAVYKGTTTLATSTSPDLTVNARGFTGAQLELKQTGPDFAFSLTSRENLDYTLGITALTSLSTERLSSQAIEKSSVALNQTHRESILPFSPSSLAISDLFGNGSLEVITADSANNRVDILTTDVGISPTSMISIAVGSHPTAVVAQDFNADGLLDLAVVNSGDNTISIAIQDSDHPGTFKSAISIAVGAVPVSVTSADFNQDGLPDLAIANFADNTVTVLTNQWLSSSSFVISSTIRVPGGPSAIVAGSFVGDSGADLAVSSFYEGVITILGNQSNGSGMFTPESQVFKTGIGPADLCTADFDGDGIADLAVSNSLEGSVSLLPGSKNNRGQFPVQMLYEGFSQPLGLAPLSSMGSLELPDLAVADFGTGGVTRLSNDGQGRFSKRAVYTVGQSLAGVANGYRFDSGSFEFFAIDPSLQSVHAVVQNWTSAGGLAPPRELLSGTNVLLQAQYLPLQAQTASVLSNVQPFSFSSKLAQTVTFSGLANTTYGSGPRRLSATASSGLPVEVSVLSGPATLSDGLLSVSAPGEVVLRATQPGDAAYAEATPVLRTFLVSKAPLSIDPEPAARLYGQSNPVFGGTIKGLVGEDTVAVGYSSFANAQTAVGVYTDPINGISARLQDSAVLFKYDVRMSVGTLTIRSCDGSGLAACGSVSTPPPPVFPIPNPPASGGMGSSGGGLHPPTPPVHHPSNGGTAMPVSGPSGLRPTGGPINALPKTADGGGSSSSSSSTLIPIPVIGLPLPSPSLPQFGVHVGRSSSGSTIHGDAGSTLVLIQESNLKSVPGLVSLKVVLSCPFQMKRSEMITLAANSRVLADVEVRSGSPSVIEVPASWVYDSAVKASFAGNMSCPSTSSDAIHIAAPPSIVETFSALSEPLLTTEEVETLVFRSSATSSELFQFKDLGKWRRPCALADGL